MKTNVAFEKACAKANCAPTRRQYSKWQSGKGIAYMVAVLKTAQPLTDADPGYVTEEFHHLEKRRYYRNCY